MSLARLTPKDWAWSLGLHGTLVLGALVWSASATHAPAFRPLQVTLAWQARVAPSPPPVSAPIPAEQPKSPPRPVARSVAPPENLQRTQAQAAPRVIPGVTHVLASAPTVVVPVVAGETVAPTSPTQVTPTAPQAAHPAPASHVGAIGPPAAPPSVAATPGAALHDEAAYQRWRDHLMHALHQHKRYPPSARRMGQTGTVHVHVRVSAAGELMRAELVESSGFKALDGAAELLVRTVLASLAGQLQPGRATELRIPVVYELKEF